MDIVTAGPALAMFATLVVTVVLLTLAHRRKQLLGYVAASFVSTAMILIVSASVMNAIAGQ